MMRIRAMIPTLLVLGSLITFPALMVAAPMPPRHVVNHTTKECATIMGGDECMECFPPEGWEILDTRAGEECPDDYVKIDDIGEECIPFKDRFCCSEGHSGVHGDCEDMILHESKRQCAFVGDIHSQTLPEGWEQKPEDLYFHQWFCPNGYEWVAEPETVPTAEPEPTATIEPVPSAVPSPDPTPTTKPQPTQPPTAESATKEPAPETKSLPCPGAALVGTVAICLSFVQRVRD